MNQIVIIWVLVILVSTQSQVTPNSQACTCSNLLSQADCIAKYGCTWTFATSKNTSTNATTTSTTQGICANLTTPEVVANPPTFCLNVTNITLCAQTIGCAFLNSTCTIFTGCSAYVQTTNEACQAISSQCTTDGIRCVTPSDCSAYTTESFCSGNLATSGAKSCKWIARGTLGTCIDKICSDAPATYTTSTQCNRWIVGCLTTGKGCVTSLGGCSSYNQANGCIGMIGSDGPCTANTTASSTVCRPLVCTDAANTFATNIACSAFLLGCVSIGKGCASALSICSTYTMTQGCTGLIGSDGPCIVNTTVGSTACRALACTDAPASTNTNAICAIFMAGCVTTGQGCTNSLAACSSYTGTTTTCSSYIGSDGNCKGTSATPAACSARTCADAPTTTNTNAACSAFQNGCVTNGTGCTAALGSCSSYTGTNTTCSQYIGSDGNCTAPSSQNTAAACAAKACTDAPNTTTTNSACQAFSYQCVTNGAGCIAPTTCEATALAISCQGNQACSSNQICLNRSSCANYINQSQCVLNQQQYLSGSTLYLRACTWSSGTCQNTTCSSLVVDNPTDVTCSKALAGCLTNGVGCIDISAPCTDYKGSQQQCQTFKGLNGTQICGNIIGAAQLNCIIKTCDNANTGGTINSQANCTSWLTGCYFDGNNNCTNSSCDKYYGVLATCTAVTTAVDGSGKAQACYQPNGAATATTACVVKVCSQAANTITTNADCNNFLSGCVTNGAGCVDPATQCTSYAGTLATCNTFTQSGSACTKSALFCRALTCTNKTPPAGTASNKLWCQAFVDTAGNNCQYDAGPTCIAAVAGSCAKFIPTSGTTDGEKALSCFRLNLDSTPTCGLATGASACVAAACNQFTIPTSATTPALKQAYCSVLTTDSTAAANSCGLALTTSTACSARACTDYGIGATITSDCDTYKSGCKFAIGGYCYTQGAACTAYVIPTAFTTDLQKAQFCASTSTTTADTFCTYQAGTSTTNCSVPAAGCNSIVMGASNVLATDSDRLAFCRAQKKNDGYTCAYITTTPTTCAAITACTSYPAIGDNDDIKQLSCAAQMDTTEGPCIYTTGANCAAPTLTNCGTVTTVGSTVTLKQAACQAYTDNSKKCGYASTSTATLCSDAACADVATTVATLTFCPTYLSTCVYDGLNCVTKVSDCATYDAKTVGSGAAVNCANLTDTSGKKCTFVSGTKCAARACTDTIASPSAVNCAAYLSSCVFNGSACVALQVNCNLYQPQGANDAAKAAVCNSLSNIATVSAKCTFITGASACINAAACNTYDLPAASQNAAQGQPACALAQDTIGNFCAFDSTAATKCAIRTCALAVTANTDSDCNTWLSGCDQDPTTPCSLTVCSSAPITETTNAACATFRKGCLTNGAGCVEPTVACSIYKGTQGTCDAFVGNSIPCTNSSTAAATDACQDRTCALNTTAKSDSECKTWLSTCVWKGTTGCVNPQPCASFTGTGDSCPTFTASDGPCYGTGSVASPAVCRSNNSLCTAAPSTYNTDAQCKTWGSACMTNGFGCILASSATCSSIILPHVCSLYKSTPGLFCDLAKQCKTRPLTCGGLATASDCISTLLAGKTKFTCAWNAVTETCVPLICELLPVTLTTDSGCRAVISTCTTNGAGCITKGACSTYPKLACSSAATTEIEKSCIWSNSACRPIQCTDNTTATSDAACNTYLAGCRTTGAGCASTVTCSTFTSAKYCLFDSTGFPCLWYQASQNAPKTCLRYTKCSDIVSSSHDLCQAVSPLCTTNGVFCIAITGCSKTILQASCIIGTDGNCGWLPAAGTSDAACVLFTNCQAAKGKTTQQCQAWGSECVSNGTACITKSTCSTYNTQTACGNVGTDGICLWVDSTRTTITGICRPVQCSDATMNTQVGCAEFKAQTACTTSGTACIPQAKCSTYQIQDGCVQGTDGVCFWATTKTTNNNTTADSTSSVCRLKQCTDSLLTTSASCASEIVGVKCVSNGVNCISQSTCSLYTERESCLGGGSDGACAFTPGTNTTTPNVGTCTLFVQCTNANSDQTACNSRSDACFFNLAVTNGTTISSCQPHTCATKALGQSCQPVPSWDLSTYQICILNGINCDAGNPSQLTASTCYTNSVGTYSWNVNTKTCTACISTITTSNNSNNPINNTTYGLLISLVLSISLLI